MARPALRIVLSLGMLQPRPPAEACALARDLGYEGVQLAILPEPEHAEALPDVDVHEWRQAAEAAGLAIASVELRLPASCSLTDPDEEVHRRTAALMERAAELCALAGAQVVAHGAPRAPAAAGRPTEEAWDLARERIAHIGSAARDCGVLYAFAPAAMEVAPSMEEAVKLLDAIQNPALRLMLDTSCVTATEAIVLDDILQRWAPEEYLVHVQLQDTQGGGPGQGKDEYGAVLRALMQLRDFGSYGGAVALAAATPQPDGPTCAAHSIGFVRGVIQGLR